MPPRRSRQAPSAWAIAGGMSNLTLRHITLAVEKAFFYIGQIAGDLFHPGLLGIGRTTREVNAAGGEFQDEEQIDGDQAVLGPNFDRREIDGRQHVPMGLEKGLPS